MGRQPEARSRTVGARPLLYYITDRQALPGNSVLPVIERAIEAGVELIQVRERDLETRSLLSLVEGAAERAEGRPSRLLVNDRLDVALTAGVGLHLPTHGLPVAEVRQGYPTLLIGASCHSQEELRRAEEGGADFAVFGPVYETPSKEPFGPPLGVEKLALAVGAVGIPVLALGGITVENAVACLQAGAAGLAGISLFQGAADLRQTVAALRALKTG
ncbi:MAG: thiamine phosphate synthase [Terriglobia bacterium]